MERGGGSKEESTQVCAITIFTVDYCGGIGAVRVADDCAAASFARATSQAFAAGFARESAQPKRMNFIDCGAFLTLRGRRRKRAAPRPAIAEPAKSDLGFPEMILCKSDLIRSFSLSSFLPCVIDCRESASWAISSCLRWVICFLLAIVCRVRFLCVRVQKEGCLAFS